MKSSKLLLALSEAALLGSCSTIGGGLSSAAGVISSGTRRPSSD